MASRRSGFCLYLRSASIRIALTCLRYYGSVWHLKLRVPAERRFDSRRFMIFALRSSCGASHAAWLTEKKRKDEESLGNDLHASEEVCSI